MKRCATSCAGMSVHIERMTAMSSTCSPSFGKTSLTSMPDLPIFVELERRAERQPVMPGDASCPSYFVSAGFGSHVSTCDGPPSAKMWMTCLALAGKCGCFGASGPAIFAPAPAAAPSRPRVDPEAATRGSCAEAHARAEQELAAGEDDVVRGRRVFADVFFVRIDGLAHDGFLGFVCLN